MANFSNILNRFMNEHISNQGYYANTYYETLKDGRSITDHLEDIAEAYNVTYVSDMIATPDGEHSILSVCWLDAYGHNNAIFFIDNDSVEE